ncbi:MAG: Flp pilus assembly complex ATPase component TadA [Phycisphaerae bacterium]|nr:Flp pilus assembly complex ATPase component TadA [Phycisphaerae bacterium]
MPTLEITANGKKRLVRFGGPAVTIGRSEHNDVVLHDSVASRRHCLIEHREGAFKLKDLNSHNGTWMGENRILEANLTFGDALRIGSTHIRLLPDEVDSKKKKKRKTLPTAEIVPESAEELPPSPPDRKKVATTLAARALVSGPLSRQLAPLMEACVNVPVPEGAPEVGRDIRLLNRKSEPLSIEKEKTSKSKPAEALEAMRQLLFAGFRTTATDIHIEPKGEVYAIRFRIDGLLHAVGEITSKMAVAVLNVVKILCEIDIAKKNVVQEGNFAVELPDRRVDFRVSMTPTVHGQKLALRFLDKATVPSQFENLGMDLDAVAELTRVCQKDSGMVILAGPTGSGKTTTLYTALQTIDAASRNIVTIEDPVEYELAGTTQISVDAMHGVTFASVLSSVLRQDPDVILVGEIRDNETARMAMQAATTGHLVMTTIHARDTVGTVFRLLDLGVEPFLIANSVTMCISQRLVRVLCPTCKRAYRPEAHVVRRACLEDRPHGDFFEAVGCKKCMGVGYRGRMALFEMLLFNSQVRDVILTEPTITDIRKAAGEWMFQTLAESGYRRVIEGITTVEEVERVAGTV